MKSKMKKVLLILSFLRSSPKTVEEALKIAGENRAELVVFFVLDVEYADNIARKLADEGWLGEKPSQQLYDSLLREYQSQAEKKIAEIRRRAEALNVPMRAIIKSGALLEETLRLASLEDPDLIVITRRKRSSLSRLIFGSLVNTLKKQVRCQVKIIDAEF
jgi:nucleotide-binding universal stress UspA family protein